MSRASSREKQLLFITRRIEGMPKISFNFQALGKTAVDSKSADVCGPTLSNSSKTMMGMKLIAQTVPHIVSFANVLSDPTPVADAFAEDIDAGDRQIDRSSGVQLKLVSSSS
jgi:hypothetical protein